MKKPDKAKLMPDRFVLEKKEVANIFDSVGSHWKRDDLSTIQNVGYIANMEIIKAAVKLNDTKVLAHLYFSITQAVHQIETLNTLKLSLLEAQEQNLDEKVIKSFQQLYNLQSQKIDSGDAFVEN